MGHSVTAPAATGTPGSHARSGFWGLAICSVGVVYGDIGTSPLYAFREALRAATGGSATVEREAVLGELFGDVYYHRERVAALSGY